MALNSEKFAAARRASGMTYAQIAEAAGLKSTSTYAAHEEAPTQFRLEEIVGMYGSMNEIAQGILKDAVCDIFLPA
ncbi:MAG: hypothetical protein IJI88_02335 [Atopobiaceae bacterium]|nr:hypothetical protein [Atopobiaceae bacterium]